MVKSWYNGPYAPTYQWTYPWSPLFSCFPPSSQCIQSITEMPGSAHCYLVINYVIPVSHFFYQSVELDVHCFHVISWSPSAGSQQPQGYLYDVMTSSYSNYANFTCCHARDNNFTH